MLYLQEKNISQKNCINLLTCINANKLIYASYFCRYFYFQHLKVGYSKPLINNFTKHPMLRLGNQKKNLMIKFTTVLNSPHRVFGWCPWLSTVPGIKVSATRTCWVQPANSYSKKFTRSRPEYICNDLFSEIYKAPCLLHSPKEITEENGPAAAQQASP